MAIKTFSIYVDKLFQFGIHFTFFQQQKMSEEQHTYAMIKPGYEEYWGKVIERIIEEGLQIVRMKTMQFDNNFASQFYAEHVGKGFFGDLSGYMTSGQIVAMELAGPNAIAKWREIIGPTKKEVAVETAPNSLRALYARSTTENLCHGSDAPETAAREIALVFAEEIAEDAKMAAREAVDGAKEKVADAKEKAEQAKQKSKCCLLI
ncbi:Nucleoside diphosphate kinase [Tritrichomonas foetus]|uniref:Nucleoside diphosphate kinase n=1 Tax=Tritrichomonas foetus TaxID=1144522 RepID=A0A1J4J410_9EUKA|nr:Nucleoside diphosphate kinase [Tritrichomonas foetus]|eukprot:OHS93481.1 Nucleoside diphosphate kinase [Tritrichomonas foetus]